MLDSSYVMLSLYSSYKRVELTCAPLQVNQRSLDPSKSRVTFIFEFKLSAMRLVWNLVVIDRLRLNVLIGCVNLSLRVVSKCKQGELSNFGTYQKSFVACSHMT
jgi:hypothetical protein